MIAAFFKGVMCTDPLHPGCYSSPTLQLPLPPSESQDGAHPSQAQTGSPPPPCFLFRKMQGPQET